MCCSSLGLENNDLFPLLAVGCGEGQTCGFDSLCYNCSNLEDAMIVGGTVLKITTSENGRCAVECPLGSAGKSCQYPARAPAEWTCDTDNYASADGCHCSKYYLPSPISFFLKDKLLRNIFVSANV